MGTPHYMSPEQLTGDPLDARSDLFAVGAILFELLVGNAAFPGERRPPRSSTPSCTSRCPSLGGSPALAAVDRVIHRATVQEARATAIADAAAMAQELRAALRSGRLRRDAGRAHDDAADRAAVPDAPAGSRDRLPLVQPRRRDHRLARQPRVAGRALEPRGRPVQGRRARPGGARHPSWTSMRR